VWLLKELLPYITTGSIEPQYVPGRFIYSLVSTQNVRKSIPLPTISNGPPFPIRPGVVDIVYVGKAPAVEIDTTNKHTTVKNAILNFIVPSPFSSFLQLRCKYLSKVYATFEIIKGFTC
jgi:hypothetical protein